MFLILLLQSNLHWFSISVSVLHRELTFSESDVIEMIRPLDVNKVHGHHNISFKMTKLCANSVTHPHTF